MRQLERSPSFRWFMVFSITALAVAMLMKPFAAVSAQDNSRVTIFPPDTTLFPEISFLLEPYDSAGRLITDLDSSHLTIIENGEERAVQTLERLEPGLQIIFATNAAPIWATRTAGMTHYEQIMLSIKAWVQNQPEDGPDDFSLATNTGLLIIRSDNRDQWITAIDEYQPTLMQMEASIVSLSQALDLATDTNPRPNMKRAILYITAIPNQGMLNALPNLTARARQLGVRIFVWLVGPQNQADTPGAGALRTLATESGGEYFHFTGTESLPDPDQYFQSLRYLYRVIYRSGVAESGMQRVQVELERPDAQAASREQIFTLRISPPNPIFLSPPSTISRQRQEPPSRSDPPRLAPDAAIIQYLVEFPDGYPRELRAARLYVDGVLAVEQTTGPFERFQWSLTDYEESGSHVLQVEVEDEL
ncbi:MAG TPA: hypothetical protein VLH85_00385, partial [Levilinea sp.]|nr:hypothetical protein [Levilinea sp.]